MNGRLRTAACLLGLLSFGLAACAPGMPISVEPVATQWVATQLVEVEPTAAPAEPTEEPATSGVAATSTATGVPSPLPTLPPALTTTLAAPTPPAVPTATALPTAPPAARPEPRLVEFEWPLEMKLGESDLIRLALLPFEEGYVAVAEFEDHSAQTAPLEIARPPGYDLFAIARLDATSFEITPGAEQMLPVPVGEPVTWRWNVQPRSAGRQRVQLSLMLHWRPRDPDGGLPTRETAVWSQGLTIRVSSLLGLSVQEARGVGFTSLVLAGVVSIPWFGLTLRERRQRIRAERAPRQPGHIPRPAEPNPNLVIDLPHGTALAGEEAALLRSAFFSYERLALQAEYVSGYSGARTFLALPTRPDGGHDAPTIIKIGLRETIVHEYRNYETYVKRTLPPVTARIQEPPVVLDGPRAALRYTFVGAPQRMPQSLRDVALTRPAARVATLLETLFETFGPNWWLQNRPHTDQAAAAFDSLLPSHLILEPAAGTARAVQLQRDSLGDLAPGEVVALQGVAERELRGDGNSWSLRAPGPHYARRVRFLGPKPGPTPTGRIVATRHSLLARTVAGLVADFDPQASRLPAALHGLPNPLVYYARLLQEPIHGLRSIIHGDLNLENVLVGPGDLVWLIDFADTREGLALFDFVRLETEIITHVCAPKLRAAGLTVLDFLTVLSPDPAGEAHPALAEMAALLTSVQRLARRVLPHPDRTRDHTLSRFFAAFGALKYPNLDPDQKRLLLLTAAYLLSLL